MLDQGRVLFVDDDVEIRAMLRRSLLGEGFSVDTARTAQEGIELAQDRRPDVVVMDIGLPDADGVDAVRDMRDAGLWTPVLMLTAHGDIERRVHSFKAGADDFLAKPFHTDELVLRLQALIRRAKGVDDASDRMRVGELILDTRERRCWRGTREIHLSPRELSLLEYLMRNAGRVLSRDQIADAIWGGFIAEGSNAVDVYVGYLRKKLEADGEERMLQTVRGHGFTLRAGGGE